VTSDNHNLEKTTQTDLLYGLALEHHSDVALAEVDEAKETEARAQEKSDAIRNYAATRADSSFAAIRGLLSGRRMAGKRWAYPQGWVPPVRKPEPSLIEPAEKAKTNFAPIQPRSLSQIAAGAMRGSQGWLVSLAIHMLVLLGLAIFAFPEALSKPVEALRGSSIEAYDPIEVIEVPAAEAIPTNLDLARAEPVAIEFSLPEPRFERGGMPGLMAGEATPSPVAFKSSGPVSDIFGLMSAAGRGKSRSGKGQGGAEFFGLKAAGTRFVFVVDCSLSMKENNRWAHAVTELNAAIDRLSNDQMFYVILFDGNVHRMLNHDQSQAALFAATEENKQRFREWLATARLGYDTYPLLAVKNALELSPDAIYLLSDGVFKDGTADFLKKFNRPIDHQGFPQRTAAVHTLSFHSWEGQAVMRRIARENNGKFLFIAK
jgi:outer membrane murein-binding lipoprotein Lpp